MSVPRKEWISCQLEVVGEKFESVHSSTEYIQYEEILKADRNSDIFLGIIDRTSNRCHACLAVATEQGPTLKCELTSFNPVTA